MDYIARWKLRAAIVVAALFLFSLIFSIGELRYLCFGQTTTGQLIQSREMRMGRRGSTQTYVDYQFSEPGGTLRKEQDILPAGWRPASTDRTVQIQFIANSGSSRIAGHEKMIWVYIFLFFLIALIVAGLMLWRHIARM